MSIRDNVNAAIKAAMINKEKATLQTLRMVSAAFKQIEVDQRIEITDEIALRELVRHEETEIAIIQQFLPQALSKDEIRAEVEKALAASGLPREMASMKPLMATLKPALEGRADMAFVSQYLRTLLQNS